MLMKRLLILACALFGPLLIPMQANAASNGLGVNPRRDYTIAPGDSVKDTLVVSNLNKTEDLFINIQPLDFTATDQTGAPQLLLKQKTPTRWSLKPYLTIAESYTIKAGQSAEIPFTVSIPKNVGAGSYYTAIRYSAGGNNQQSNLNLSSASTSLIFVRVSGQARSELTMKDFGTFVPDADFVNGSYKTFFGSTQPKYISYTLKNNGNLAEQPKGSVQVKNMFGRQVAMLENMNPNRQLVIIDQTRRIDVCIKAPDNANLTNTENSVEEIANCKNPNLAPGRYTATAAILYGDQNNGSKEIRATASFWYLPAWFIVLSLAALSIIAFTVWVLVKKIRNFKKPTYGTHRR